MPATAVLLAAAVASTAQATDTFAAPPIYDFFFRYQDNPDPAEYPIPLPAPAMDSIAADSPQLLDLLQDLENVGLPVAVIFPDHTAPLTGWIGDTDPSDPGSEALPTLLANVTTLDYVFLDFESKQVQANISSMPNASTGDSGGVLRLLEVHPSPDVRNAKVGNYAYFAGDTWTTDEGANFNWTESQPSPFKSVLAMNRHAFYVSTAGLNVSMPHAYVFATFRNHADEAVWGQWPASPGYLAPNERSALFWAPLERVSAAKRHLPEGDELIPWIGGFLSQGLSVDPPPREDVALIILHYRMRGIDGYATFQTNEPIPYGEYRWLMGLGYHSLDCFFEGAEAPTLHNLETDKLSGVQWSGITLGEDSAFIISNLGDEPAALSAADGWPGGVNGVPVISPKVQPGEHLLLLYDNGPALPCVADCNGNGVPDAWDILAGTSDDCDFDGKPDECFYCCPGDITGDGGVTVDDLLQIILEWGEEVSGADVNLDGRVDVDDLITVIQGWGGCL